MGNKKILHYMSLAFAALAMLVQILAVIMQYDKGSNYFNNGAFLPTAAVAVALIAAAFGTVFACTARCDAGSADVFSDTSPLASALSATGFVVAAVCLILHFAATPISGIAILAIFTCFGAALYALATVSAILRARVNAISFMGFLAPIACIVLNAYYYFDTTIEMNSPVKTFTQVGLLCVMLYFISEIRFLMGAPMPRVYLTICAWVQSFGALSAAIPIIYLSGKCERLDYVAGALLILCVLVASILRTQALLRSAEDASL